MMASRFSGKSEERTVGSCWRHEENDKQQLPLLILADIEAFVSGI